MATGGGLFTKPSWGAYASPLKCTSWLFFFRYFSDNQISLFGQIKNKFWVSMGQPEKILTTLTINIDKGLNTALKSYLKHFLNLLRAIQLILFSSIFFGHSLYINCLYNFLSFTLKMFLFLFFLFSCIKAHADCTILLASLEHVALK